MRLTPTQRLQMIAAIIETVDNRCLVADGAVTPTRFEMTDTEMRRIYRLTQVKKPKRNIVNKKKGSRVKKPNPRLSLNHYE